MSTAPADFCLSRGVQRRALLSSCGKYRYRLLRQWSAGAYVLWIMLNPSTADAYQDDRTVGRVCEFSRRWGYGGALIGNLYALGRPLKCLGQTRSGAPKHPLYLPGDTELLEYAP